MRTSTAALRAGAASTAATRSSTDSLRAGAGGSVAGRRGKLTPPRREVMRVKYVALSDESEGSDGEADAQLMRKYGIAL